MQNDLSPYQLFQEVFYRFYKPLCQYAGSIVQEPHACEDIVQEIFLKIWEKKQELLPKEEIRFYLFRAVHNNCLTFLEKNKKNAFSPLTGLENTGMDEVLPGTRRMPEPDINSLVAEALNRLPPKCREVFLLSRVSKLTYQQVAATLGISVKTVENQMGKAIGVMRNFVKEKKVYTTALLMVLSYLLIDCS